MEERIKLRKKRQMERRRQVMRQKMILGGVLLLILIVTIVSVTIKVKKSHAEKEAKAKAGEQAKAEAKQKKIEAENTLRFVAVGDNLLHDSLIEAGKSEDGKWSYDFLYKNVRKDIESADLAAVNQEAPIVSDHEDATGYPEFGTPVEDGDALVKAGFDIITHATNHAYDKGTVGVINSINFWNTKHKEITHLGINEDEEQAQNRVKIIEKKNFKIAMMNYTFGVNEGTPVPEDESYLINIYSEEKVKEDVAKAKEEADVVMVFLHAGYENAEEPDEDMEQKVNFLAQQGVDVAICSHPHVLWKYATKEVSSGHKMLVYYSLGNFVSTQKESKLLLEGMADFTLKKNPETGEVAVSEANLIPLVMHYNHEDKEYGVYKLSDYTKEMEEKHSIHQEEDQEFSLEGLQEKAEKLTKMETSAVEDENQDSTNSSGENG